MKPSHILLLTLILLLIACGTATPTPTTIASSPSPTTEVSVTPTLTLTIDAINLTPTIDSRLPPEAWQEWPIIPEEISPRTVAIYRRGQELGNNPQAYSKIGGCLDTPAWFLGPFDGKSSDYSLGDYTYLQEVIDTFRGSHARTSLAAGIGYSSANVLTSFMADPKICETNETPLNCEIRIHRPVFAIVDLGSNDVPHQDMFVSNMHQILDTLIDAGVVPIMVSKADNLEGDQSVNLEIAKLAYDYDIPYWNFWRVVQPLPHHGLQEDGAHLTYAGPFFNDPTRMLEAWPWRNLTALQTLDAVWRGVTSTP
jgi:hypothetical protein